MKARILIPGVVVAATLVYGFGYDPTQDPPPTEVSGAKGIPALRCPRILQETMPPGIRFPSIVVDGVVNQPVKLIYETSGTVARPTQVLIDAHPEIGRFWGGSKLLPKYELRFDDGSGEIVLASARATGAEVSLQETNQASMPARGHLSFGHTIQGSYTYRVYAQLQANAGSLFNQPSDPSVDDAFTTGNGSIRFVFTSCFDPPKGWEGSLDLKDFTVFQQYFGGPLDR